MPSTISPKAPKSRSRIATHLSPPALLLLFLVPSLSASARVSEPASPFQGAVQDATPGSVTPTVATRNTRRAEVTYDGMLLTVAANNASLNQIIREIARQTGMKVTGGVRDDRVFGTYGPATPSTILSILLDGAGSNLLIVQNASHAPTELILTPRVGGVSPPNPNAANSNDNDGSDDEAVQPFSPPPPPQPAVNSRAPTRAGTGGIDTNPAATSPSSTSQQLAFPPIDATTTPATATTTPVTADPSPDTVKTPQQIFEQLQKLRQQQTQQSKPQ